MLRSSSFRCRGQQACLTAQQPGMPWPRHKPLTRATLQPALRLPQREKKEETKAKKEESKSLLKEERMLHDTKRAHAGAVRAIARVSALLAGAPGSWLPRCYTLQRGATALLWEHQATSILSL